jgi:tRNA wybutosine-synthesizing protein 2
LNKNTAVNARLAVRIEQSKAGWAREKINTIGLLDKNRKIIVKENYVEIPVTKSIHGFNLVIQEEPKFYRKEMDLSLVLEDSIPPNIIHHLPRGWYILGDIIVVKINPILNEYEHMIADALLSCYPRARSVMRDFGIEGQLRVPNRKLIAGDKTETIHKENGVLFELDAKVVMFSQGNLLERMRMSRMGNDEFVVDMFAGIGYFSIPMAVHSRPKKILSIELNPIAFRYLCKNATRNHVEDVVIPVFGDCAKETPENWADRVIMGMVQVTDKYLHKAMLALKSGGTLHYHQTIPSWRYPNDAVGDVMNAADDLGYACEVLSSLVIKKYSPGVLHSVIDARIQKS